MFDAPPSRAQEAIKNLPPIFYNDDLLHVLDSDEEDQYQYDPFIETESHEILDLVSISILAQNTKPIWAQKLFDAARDGARNIEGELGPSIRMSMMHSLSQILSLQSGAAKFQVGAT